MKRKVKKDFVKLIYNNYIDLILVYIEEYSKYFPYTICCCNFLSDLKEEIDKVNVYSEKKDDFIDDLDIMQE